jgi:hypothetical protein
MGRRSLVESCAGEWSRYYHLPELCDLEVLHARFVEHRFGRAVRAGAAIYWTRSRGAQGSVKSCMRRILEFLLFLQGFAP